MMSRLIRSTNVRQSDFVERPSFLSLLATITFAGNLQGRTQTLPLAVFVALESDRDTAIALSLLMVVISLTVLIVLRDRWWRSV